MSAPPVGSCLFWDVPHPCLGLAGAQPRSPLHNRAELMGHHRGLISPLALADRLVFI